MTMAPGRNGAEPTRPPAGRRIRVLYNQMRDGGGSAVSLLELISGLDLDRFEPVVLFNRRNSYADRLEADGVRTVFIESRDPPSGRGAQRAEKRPTEPANGSGGRWRRGRSLRDLKRLFLSDWSSARTIENIVRRERPDLVHQNNNPRIGRATYLAASRVGVAQVGHVRWLHDYTAVDRWVAKRVDFFIFITHAVRKSCDPLSIPESRKRVIYDPLHHDRLNAGIGRDELRQELGIAAHAKVVASVGRLTAWKGQDDFIRSLAALPPELGVHGLIVGSPGDRQADRQYERSLRELARELGISHRMRFLGFREDVGAVIRAADVVVHSSKRPEPFGRVIVEAMAANRPVIATAAGGALEAVDDGRTGVLVPMADPEAMSRALFGLLTDEERAARLERAGREEVKRRFSVAKHATEVQEVYEQILESRGR